LDASLKSGAFLCPKGGIFMGRNISIAISAKDNFSDAVNKMNNSGIRFNKNLEEMQAQLNAINKNRATLKLDVSEARKNLQALQKEYNAAKKSG
jgi:predicted  nucleic acid-binding Zn-ribbon protein